jgi:hypothetical protein
MSEPEKREFESRRRAILAVIKESALNSTLQGLPNIVRSDLVVIKLLWIACMLLSMAGCGFFCMKATLSYLQYDVVTNIKLISDVPAIFPTIIICSFNAFVTNEGLSYSENYFKDTFENNPYFFGKPDFVKTFAVLNSKEQNILSDQERKSFSIDLKEILLKCTRDYTISCTELDFEHFYDASQGSCWKYNSGRNSSGQDIEDKKSVKGG